MEIIVEYDGEIYLKVKLSKSQLKALIQTGTTVCGKWTISATEVGLSVDCYKEWNTIFLSGDKGNSNSADKIHEMLNKRVLNSLKEAKNE